MEQRFFHIFKCILSTVCLWHFMRISVSGINAVLVQIEARKDQAILLREFVIVD